MRRIRVVRVIHHLVRGGGVQTRLTELLPRLAEHVDVRVLCYKKRGELADDLEAAGVPVDLVPRGPKWSPRNLATFAGYFRRHGVDVVHTHSYTANTMGVVAARLARVPVRIRHIHTLIPWGRERPYRTALRKVADRWAAGMADVTLAVSAAARDRFLRGTRLPDAACRVLYNGVDLTRFADARERGGAVREEFGVSPEAPVVGVVGRLARGKGQSEFLKAARIVKERRPEARFLVVGEGPFRKELEETARALGLEDRVVFTGYRRDIPAILGSLDLFVFPGLPDADGRIPDGLPGVVIEAQAAGVPVVAFDLPMMPELLPADVPSGCLVPTGDVEALARAVEGFLDRGEERELLERAAKRNAQRFSIDRCVENTLALYEEYLRRKVPSRPARRGEG
ncbi:glycosyltransferase [Deferrisoma palaeochoriense]